MTDYEQAVFISYAWGGEHEEIVNQIDQALQERGVKILRDKRTLGYKGSIQEFMQRIGRGNCVIVVVSDKYLRSPNCMFELIEIAEGKEFHDRIFPIILANANIYDPLKRIEYIQYWEMKRAELAAVIKTLDPANLQGIREDMDLYDRIRDKIAGLTSILKDMNVLTPDMHRDSQFAELYDAIETRMKESVSSAAQPSSTSVPESGDPEQITGPGTRAPSDTPSSVPQQNFNVGGGVFTGPVQFGATTQHIESVQNIGSIQNVYYAHPGAEKAGSRPGTGTIEREYFEPETVLIPGGVFRMGSQPGDDIPVYETPRHELFLTEYRIGKYPVTNLQYEQFVRETRRSIAPEMGWHGQKVPAGMERLPVAGVSWYDAYAYCEWLRAKTGRNYSLPDESQWEKASRGGQEGIFPWGNIFDPARCNHAGAELVPVDQYPAQNDYGCFDFVGNVRQWTCTLWGEKRLMPDPVYAYPWKNDGRNDLQAGRHLRRVVRGSTSNDPIHMFRCSARRGEVPTEIGLPGARHGFRVAMTD